jgi:hypothetical protein
LQEVGGIIYSSNILKKIFSLTTAPPHWFRSTMTPCSPIACSSPRPAHLVPHARRQRGEVQAHARQHERLQLKGGLHGAPPPPHLLQSQVVEVVLRPHRLHQPAQAGQRGAMRSEEAVLGDTQPSKQQRGVREGSPCLPHTLAALHPPPLPSPPLPCPPDPPFRRPFLTTAPARPCPA